MINRVIIVWLLIIGVYTAVDANEIAENISPEIEELVDTIIASVLFLVSAVIAIVIDSKDG